MAEKKGQKGRRRASHSCQPEKTVQGKGEEKEAIAERDLMIHRGHPGAQGSPTTNKGQVATHHTNAVKFGCDVTHLRSFRTYRSLRGRI